MRQIGGGRCETCGRVGRLIDLIWVYVCEDVCIHVYMSVIVCMCVNM